MVLLPPDDDISSNGDKDDGGWLAFISLEETLDRAFVELLGNTLRLHWYLACKVLRSNVWPPHIEGIPFRHAGHEASDRPWILRNAIASNKSSLPTLLPRLPVLIFRLVAFLGSAWLRILLRAIGPILCQRQGAMLLDAVAPVVIGQMMPPLALDDASHKHDDVAGGTGSNSSTLRQNTNVLKIRQRYHAAPAQDRGNLPNYGGGGQRPKEECQNTQFLPNPIVPSGCILPQCH